MTAYQDWIDTWLGSNNPYGRCKEASEAMQKEFPELRLVAGYVETAWGRRGHWWLETPTGEKVDATESQFPGGCFEYEEYIKGVSNHLLGKCMNCGWEIWGIEGSDTRKDACSNACLVRLCKDYGLDRSTYTGTFYFRDEYI